MVSKLVCRQNRHWLITLIHTRKPGSLFGISAAAAIRNFISQKQFFCVCDTLYCPPSASLPAPIHPPVSLWITVWKVSSPSALNHERPNLCVCWMEEWIAAWALPSVTALKLFLFHILFQRLAQQKHSKKQAPSFTSVTFQQECNRNRPLSR